LYLLN